MLHKTQFIVIIRTYPETNIHIIRKTMAIMSRYYAWLRETNAQRKHAWTAVSK